MPAPERNRWAEWVQIGKERKEAARVSFNEWVEQVKLEPTLIWQTPAVRYTTYAIGSIVAVLIVRTAIDMIQPVPASMITPRARTADFNVICSNPQCRKNFTIQRKFNFHDFPVKCPFCKQMTGQHAMRCRSETCHGKLVITKTSEGVTRCTECDAPIGKAK